MTGEPDILIVSYRRADLLQACMDSVARHLPGAQIRVWDNASDASHEIRALAENRPDVDWHFCEENIGFAAAVNRLMERVRSESALLLNPDAVLLSDLSQTRKAVLDPGVAAAAPWLRDRGRRPWDNAHREPTLLREVVSYAGWDDRLGRRPYLSEMYATQPQEVGGYLTGACLLISMSAWRQVGPFDERYFLYGEEADWCHRAREAGLRLLSIAEEGIAHSAGGTVSDAVTARSRSRQLLDENRRRYMRDHHGPLASALYTASTTVIEAVQPSKRRTRRAGRAAEAPDFIITTPTLAFGGAERQRVQLANALVARGFRVRLRVLQDRLDLGSDLDPRVELVQSGYRNVARDAGPRTLLVTGTTRIECAHGLAWRNLNRPWGRWVAANHAFSREDAPTFSREAIHMLRRSDGIVYLSDVHRADHRRHVDLDRGRSWVIPNGVPVRATPPDSGDRNRPVRFVVASRLEEFKQIHLLVDAFSTGLDDLDWQLDVWGDGPYRQEIEARIPARLQDRIRMRGWCTNVQGVLDTSDVYCMPSRLEAMPMVILEAMESGVCVAASPVSSVPEMLADGAGVLVDPPTVDQWRRVLRRLVEEPDFRISTARAGRARVRSMYSIDAMTDRYVQMREDLLPR